MKRIAIPLVLLLSVLLSACGAQATPTISPADVQSTAMAGALTVIAQTKAAIPTNTPEPTATNTPVSTDTPIPSPTIEVPTLSSLLPTIVPTKPATSNGTDDCLHPLNTGEAGPTHDTLVKNQSGGSIILSLNLYKKNEFGQCGAISYNLNKGDSVMANLPAGYWYAFAWMTIKGKQSSSSGSFFVQPAQFDKLELCVRKDNIVYGPSC